MNKRNTVQKELIARIVEEACDHPTAETVYARAKAELPNISLGTVYRVLNALVLEGKAVELSFPNLPSRFDKTLHPHAHMFCEKCGSVVDIEYKANKSLSDVLSLGSSILSSANVALVGICENCVIESAENMQ